MLLLLATAHAALPWECPTLGAPPDGPQFRTDAGLADTFSALDALADAWVEPDCAWADTTLDTGAIESTRTTSTGAIVTVTTTEGTATGEMFPSDYRDWSSWALVVELPEGMDRWTRLDDMSFTLSDSSSCSFGMCDDRTTVDTPACDWSWGAGDAIQSQWVRSGGHEAIRTQDCDGVDAPEDTAEDTDAPEDTAAPEDSATSEDSAEPDDTGMPPSAEPPAEPGCGGRGAWLVLGGVALLRPRR